MEAVCQAPRDIGSGLVILLDLEVKHAPPNADRLKAGYPG